MARTGKGIDLNLNGAAKVSANQAYGRKPRIIMNEDSRDFGYRCRRSKAVIFCGSQVELRRLSRFGLVVQKANQSSQSQQPPKGQETVQG